jgi:hypothetical protein
VKPRQCTPTNQGLSNCTKSVARGVMMWEILTWQISKANKLPSIIHYPPSLKLYAPHPCNYSFYVHGIPIMLQQKTLRGRNTWSSIHTWNNVIHHIQKHECILIPIMPLGLALLLSKQSMDNKVIFKVNKTQEQNCEFTWNWKPQSKCNIWIGPKYK